MEDAPATSTDSGDVEMAEGSAATTANPGGESSAATAAAGTAGDNQNGSELPFAEGGPDDPPAPRVTILQYQVSPIVTLLIGSEGRVS